MKKRITLLGVVLIALLGALIGSASAAGHFISGANIQLIDTVAYNGQAFTPKVHAEFCGIGLEEGMDYSLSYSDNLLPGIATVTLTGKGNFTGTKDVHFLIQRADISDAVVTGIQDADTTGERITQNITVTLNGVVLEKDVDWMVHYYQNVRPGTAKMLIMGIGNYTGVLEKTFFINYVGQSKEQTVNQSTRDQSINLEVGQPLDLSVSSLGSDWSFVKYTVSDGRSSTDGAYSVAFMKSGTYTVTCSFSYYSVGYEYVNGVLRKVVRTDSASCALTITVEDKGDDVEAVEFLAYEEDGTKAVNLLLQVSGDNAADPELSWSSSDTSVARVDSFGRVTVKKAGTTMITAQTANGKYMKVELALDPLNIASKGKLLGLWENADGNYSVRVAYDREVLKENVDYVINSITESNGSVTVAINGTGVFGGTLTAVLPAPDFESVQYRIQTIQSSGGTITVSLSRAKFGETVTIVVVPDSGYQLHRVYLDGKEFSGSSFTVSGDHTVQADFIPAAQGDTWDGTSTAGFTSGTGTQNDPYQIYSAANLAYMAERVNAGDADYVSAYYVLMNDINLAGYEWTPIGVGIAQSSGYLTATSTNAFKGCFDGNGKMIYGLTMTAKMQKSYAGLFGSLSGAEVNNLTIKNAVVQITYSGYGYSFGGVLAGGAHNATIENCVMDGGQVLGAGAYSQVGGLVGVVSADSNTAGTIEGCASSAEIGGKAANAGGLIGLINYSTVKYCLAAGEVNPTAVVNVGGFTGVLYRGSIQYCQAVADVTHGSYSGGFVGRIAGGSVKDSFCTGAVAGSSSAGGFAGYVMGGTFSTCWSGSSVSGTSNTTYVGGFAGYCNVTNAVGNAYFVGGIETENTYTGAMYGYYSGSTTSLGSSYRARLFGGAVTLNRLCGNNSTLTPKGISETERRSESFYKNKMFFNLTSVWALDGDMLYLTAPELAVQSVEITKGADQIFCTLNQPAQVDGLTLKVTCSNGLVYDTDSGYTVSGDTSMPGEIQLVVSVQGAKTSCSAVVLGDYFARIDSMTEDLARVTVQAKESGLLIVAVYEQSGRMVGCEFKDVAAGTSQVNVFMGLGELPVGYETQLFLIQNDSYVPLAKL